MHTDAYVSVIMTTTADPTRTRGLSAGPHATKRAARQAPQPPDSDLCHVRCIHEDTVARARSARKDPAAVVALADTLRALGDPTRLRIAFALAREELCVCDLATVLGVAQPVVSQSLRALRHMGVVRYRRSGKIAYYSLDDDHIARIIDEGFRHVEEPRERGR